MKYPQPPFKKFVKCENGAIVETTGKLIEPAVFNKKGAPLFRFGWLISYTGYFKDGSGSVTLVDRVIATADKKEDL